MDVGVIGVGTMGKNHVRVYSELKRVDGLYVFDMNDTSASRVASSYEAKVCSTIDELLERVDAVSICVPTQFHHQVAMKVLTVWCTRPD